MFLDHVVSIDPYGCLICLVARSLNFASAATKKSHPQHCQHQWLSGAQVVQGPGLDKLSALPNISQWTVDPCVAQKAHRRCSFCVDSSLQHPDH